MIRGMNTISISPFLRPTTDTFTEVMNATGQTYINNRPHDGSVTTLVVVGHRLAHPEALDRLVTAAVAGFRDEPIARQPKPQPLTPGEKKKKIAELRRRNEQSPACRYSRQCNICFSSSPTSRAVLTACGHSLCMACVLQMEVDGGLDCPYCRKASGYVKLHEEKETGEERKQVASAIASLTLAQSSDNDAQSAPRPTLLNASAPEFIPSFPRWDTTTQRLQSPDPTLITPFVNASSSTASASFNPTIPPPIVSRTTLTVYIGNLNPSTTERELRELFSSAGEVRNIALPIDRVTGLGRGFGFCNFLNESSAQNAVDLFNGKNGLIAKHIIIMATLTGSQAYMTGKTHAAVMCSQEESEEKIVSAGLVSGDLVHPMIYAPDMHAIDLYSPVADMNNANWGDVQHLLPPRSAAAALFIGSNIEYGEDVDWIHVDMLAPSHCEGRSTAWGVSLVVASLGKATAVPLLQTLGQ
ncbi:hypothetical protein PRIPAC_72344 [Pristionchus pacificus]|uniref:Peptidase n=1 Tax=Pristionchus pacificus TaxID=54126 RepID=A0A2A6C648_PRIPA|nr:hypothetical protein PRIPAC_72344 [Pristionchus pacificus]|eukprot:PDM73577.1 Peptidase [Pristionchus pacificus]